MNKLSKLTDQNDCLQIVFLECIVEVYISLLPLALEAGGLGIVDILEAKRSWVGRHFIPAAQLLGRKEGIHGKQMPVG